MDTEDFVFATIILLVVCLFPLAADKDAEGEFIAGLVAYAIIYCFYATIFFIFGPFIILHLIIFLFIVFYSYGMLIYQYRYWLIGAD